MQKVLILFTLVLMSLSSVLWANINLEPLLNKVQLQLMAEQWITSRTALVTVSVNAAVKDDSLDNLQGALIKKLTQLAKGEWHITAFNRRQDSSGLESVNVIAEARLEQNLLSDLRNKAKEISKPGETFSIDNIQFTPSDEELKTAYASLRQNLYQQAKDEIDALNKMYPEQKFYLHQIDFTNTNVLKVDMKMNAMMLARSSENEREVSVPVGNRQQMAATVIIAAAPQVVMQKLARN